MNAIFLKLLNMGISAGWLVLAVFILRLIMKKSPKWLHVLLWGFVALRLVMPFSIESEFSLIPSTETIPMDIEMAETPMIYSGFEVTSSEVNPIIIENSTPEVGASVNPMQVVVTVSANFWMLGVACMLLYTVISYIRLCRKIGTAVRLRENVFESENVTSPFVLGLVKPRIYLPYHMDERDRGHVIAHERAHIRRKDHWWKPLGFLLLTVYWFHPLLWLAYILLCRDIELACDEKVIGELGNDERGDYTEALLACSIDRRMISACPLAFGEVGVKQRVKSVMHYKKPGFWVIVLSLLACVVVAVCFLTSPKTEENRIFTMSGENISAINPQTIVANIKEANELDEDTTLYINEDNFLMHLTAGFAFEDTTFMRVFYTDKTTSAQTQVAFTDDKYTVHEPSEWPEQNRRVHYTDFLEALKYLPQEMIRELSPDADRYHVTLRMEGTPVMYEHSITYSAERAGRNVVNSWLIHFEIQPMVQTGENSWASKDAKPIHVFYHRDFKPTETADTANSTEIYENQSLGIRMTFPDSWKGKYSIKENPQSPQSLLINTYWGGTLGTVQRRTAQEWIKSGRGENIPVEYRILSENEREVWLLYFASDVQFDPRDEEQINTYYAMNNDLYSIGFEVVDANSETENSIAALVADERELLTIDILKELVERYGENLTWEHFSAYQSHDIGSGLYILRYPIHGDCYLLIGGVPTSVPMYIRLVSEMNHDKWMDVLTEDIDAFLADLPLILVESADTKIEPYMHFKWAEVWSESGWMSGDGTYLPDKFPKIANEIPTVTYGKDFTVLYGEGVNLQSVSVYDEEFTELHTGEKVSVVGELSPGTYYLGIHIKAQGEYIASEDRHESTGYECVCRIIIEE